MELFKKVKNFIEKYERHLGGAALLTGFTVDSLTLTRIDLWFDNLILFFYLTLATGSILVINSVKKPRRYQRFLPYIMQYAFGGLFSGFVIFYSRSSSLIGSWPFILVLVLLLVGNEFFKGRYERLTFNISILFVAIFSFSIFFVPVLLGKMGAYIFILSGIVSLIIIGAVIYLLSFFTKDKVKKYRSKLRISIAIIFVTFNVLYFTNIIPPIPLSLKDVGIYHRVERNTDNNYSLYYEEYSWYQFYKRDEFHHVSGVPLYCFSAVFAPTKISGDIYHEWSYFDKNEREWVSKGRISYPIIGGRDGGYRGYTFRRELEEGKWRVDIETERGQLLGRVKFEVIKASELPPLTIERK